MRVGPFALLLLFAGAASAQEEEQPSEPTQSCIDAFAAGQELRRAGHLRASRDKFGQCAKPHCPEAIGEKCVQWTSELTAAIPSVVIVARDPQKRDLIDVHVFVDGELRARKLDGRGLDVDPGKHRFRIERGGTKTVERELLIVEGHKGRRIEVVLAPPPRPRPPPPQPPEPVAHSISPVAWIGIGLGAAGLIAGGITAGLSAARLDELEETCTTSWQGETYCLPAEQSAYDDGRALADASTASFIVGGVALGVGIVALLVSLANAPAERAELRRLEVKF